MKAIYKQINDYLDYCKYTRGMTKTTISSKRSVYRLFVKDSKCKDLRQLTNDDFNKWSKKCLKRGVSIHSVNDYNSKILAMLRYYRELGMNMPIKLPLIQPIKEPKTKRVFYSREQIEEVLDVADNRARLMIEIAFDTGLRLFELTDLKIQDFCDRRIDILGKGRKRDEVYITLSTKRDLEKFIREEKIVDYLWVNEFGWHMSSSSVRACMDKPFFEAGHEDFHPHALRHSFATDLQLKGASIEEIQQMMRHSNFATTQRYMHGFEGQKAKLFDKYH